MSRAKHEVNLWIVPFKISCGAVLLFVLTMIPDMLAAYHVIQLPTWFTMGGIDDARAILGAMLGCVSTVLALIFSVTLLVLSMVANLFGPRLLYRFVQDWVTQTCIGLFMGAFIYVFLIFLVTHKDEHSEFIPQTCLITSWFVVLAAFAFLVFYSHRVALLIQNPDAIGRIVDDLRTVVATERLEAGKAGDAGAERSWPSQVKVMSKSSGYLQLIDYKRLIEKAAAHDGFVELYFRPGQFILEGEAVGAVSTGGNHAGLATEVLRGIEIGRHRVLDQDFEFGIAQIVEIGIRALSPAVNDTFTGVACVDLVGEALSSLHETLSAGGRWFDQQGTQRLQVRPLQLTRLIRQAFDQIRQASTDNPAVSMRLLTTITRLGLRMQEADPRGALLGEANAVWEGVNQKPLVELDRADLKAAWERACGTLAMGRNG